MADRKSKSRPSTSQMQAVAELFAVLSEPSRLSILQALESGAKSVSQLIDATGMKQANVSKQLGILHKAGLLSRSRDGNQVLYKIRMPLVFKLCDLVCGELHKEAQERARLLSPQ